MSWSLFLARKGAREAGRAGDSLQSAGSAAFFALALPAAVVGSLISDADSFVIRTLIGGAWLYGSLLALALLVLLARRPHPTAPATPARENALDLVERIRRENGETR